MEVKQMENENKRWEAINHLINLGLNNTDGLLWKFEVGTYCDDSRTSVRGMPIGFMTGEGFVSNPRDKEYIYKLVYTTDGYVIFFRKSRD